MYVVYSAVLRNGEKGKYTNTLHALASAVTSLSRKGFPEKVFRGIGVRAFKSEDFKRGVCGDGSTVVHEGPVGGAPVLDVGW